MTARPSKTGFSPTENLGFAISIAILLMGAIWLVATTAHQLQRVNETETEILQIMQGVRGLYAPANVIGSAGNITQNVIGAGAIPNDYVTGTTMRGPLPGSSVRILTNAPTDNGFTLEIAGLDRQTCIAILALLGGPERNGGLTAIASASASGPVAKGVPGKALPLILNPLAGDVTSANGAAACSAPEYAQFVQLEFSLN